jgi:predicted nucleic-acid-binding protein
MRAIDTNIVVRLVIRDNPAQVHAAEEFTSSGVWISNVVLAESSWVLNAVYGRTAQQIATAIDVLLNNKNVTIQDSDVVISALEQFRRRPGLGFSDCLVLEIARKAGHLPLGTFDRDLAKLDGAQRV